MPRPRLTGLPASIGEQILGVISHMTYADSSMNTSWSS